MSFDDFDFDEEADTKPKGAYPKCYIDKKHDGDPICKQCALDLYGKTPAKKFKFPRNCWKCEESGGTDDFADIVDESYDDAFFEE